MTERHLILILIFDISLSIKEILFEVVFTFDCKNLKQVRTNIGLADTLIPSSFVCNLNKIFQR